MIILFYFLIRVDLGFESNDSDQYLRVVFEWFI
jgi:hypothetical protein